MRHERDAAVVSALRLVTLFVEYCNDRVFPLLWDFPLAPDEGGESVELQQDGPILSPQIDDEQVKQQVVHVVCGRNWNPKFRSILVCGLLSACRFNYVVP